MLENLEIVNKRKGLNVVKKILSSKLGSSIFEWVVVIAVVAIIAMIVSPKVKDGIQTRATSTINRINELETIMAAPKN